MSRRVQSRFPWAVCLLVTVVFFVCNHDWRASLSVFEPGIDAASLGIEQGSLARELALAAFAAFGIHALWPRPAVATRAWMPLTILGVAFIAWACASVLWADDAMLAMRRAAVLIAL